MNVYFLADTHLGMKGDNHIWLNDCINYYYNVFIPYCKEHVQKDDVLVHLGDVYDNRSAIGIETIYKSIKLFEDLSQIFSKIIIIVGNHDIFNKNTNDVTSLNMLKYIPNIEIIYRPEIRKLENKDVLFVPWIEDKDEQKKLLSSHNVDYVFGHLEIGGAVMSSKGNTLKSNNSIQSEDFKKAQVFAGHIHIRQNFKNIHYCGTPYHKDRGDIGNQKGFTILDIESGKTTFIPNTYSPEFIKVNVDDILDKTIYDLEKEWKDKYVDIVVKNEYAPYCRFDIIRENLSNVYREFNHVPDKTEINVIENVEMDFSETKSMNEMVEKYMDNMVIDESVKNNVLKKLETYKDKIQI